MSELSWILETIKGSGNAAAPAFALVFALLWWREQGKAKEQGALLSANTTALTVLAVTVNSVFQAVLSGGKDRK